MRGWRVCLCEGVWCVCVRGWRVCLCEGVGGCGAPFDKGIL